MGPVDRRDRPRGDVRRCRLCGEEAKGGNFVWTHPDYAKLDIQSIAITVTSYGNDLDAEKHVEAGLGAALRAANYRWVSGSSSRDRLRAQGGDSLLSLVRTNVTNQVRIDSLAAPALCQRLGVDALLSVRIDLWERFEPEWDQAGKPTTSVQIRAALVDSLGRLLWNAAGTETGEGRATIRVRPRSVCPDRGPVVRDRSPPRVERRRSTRC